MEINFRDIILDIQNIVNFMSKKYFYKLSKVFLVFLFLFTFSLILVKAEATNSSVATASKLPNFSDIGDLITGFNKNIIQNLTIMLSGLAVVVFLWGLVKFIYDRTRGNDKSLADDKKAMLWGLVALFVLVSLWGIIKAVQGIAGISSDNTINMPKLCFSGECAISAPSKATTNGITGADTASSGDGFDNTPVSNLGTTYNSNYTLDSINSWPDELGQGTSGDNVAQLQKFLSEKAGISLSVDGSYGPNTIAAVKSFQTSNKLVPDGIVGPSTKAVIMYNYMNATPESNVSFVSGWPDLAYGSNGSAVGQLQTILRNNNCYASGANSDSDNMFGADTKNAVIAFQAINALKEDAIVGPSTRAVIMSPNTYRCN